MRVGALELTAYGVTAALVQVEASQETATAEAARADDWPARAVYFLAIRRVMRLAAFI